ncbi:Uncharacterised protein [Kluyvera cryocrescens]|uniref:Uncharacterized protein n=1 Tax=Kluyvera cryocrescens TaxID=580 RepID=A0A485BMK6_KLUCR|nr:Uncharacterised protein [Kluyvera cryocrescens]
MSDLSELDMSDALIGWEQPLKLKTRTEKTVDFEASVIVTSQDILAVVQSANKENLTLDSLDWSKEYLLIHARLKIETGPVHRKGREGLQSRVPGRLHGLWDSAPSLPRKPGSRYWCQRHDTTPPESGRAFRS